MSLKDYKVYYHANRSFQLNLSVFSDYQKGKTYSVVGEYLSVPKGTQVDAIMQMFLNTRNSKWSNSNGLFRTYQNSYVIKNEEKQLGTIELVGAMTDMQVERIKNFLMVEDREFIASYHDYRAETSLIFPEIYETKVILEEIEYQEIENTNNYNVRITLTRLTNWSLLREYSTFNGQLNYGFLGVSAYEYEYDFQYGADATEAGTIITSSIYNEGNEKAPFILDIQDPTTNFEYYFVTGVDALGNNIVSSSGKVFGTYNAIKVVSANITDNFENITKQGIYGRDNNNSWIEITDLDYSKENFFNIPVGSSRLVIKGINDTTVKVINISLKIYEQYRIEGS
jgi:hypothetical protein